MNFELPQVLDGVVHLTHDYLSTLPYVAVSIFDNSGAADVTSIIQATPVEEGFVWIVDTLAVRTTDAATRILTVFLHYINAAGDFSVALLSLDSGTAASRWWNPFPRFIMPPGAKLELIASALTAGASLRYTMAYLKVPAGQFVPRT